MDTSNNKIKIISLHYSNARTLLADYLSDLGAGGLRVRSDERLTEGESVAIDLLLPDGETLLELKGIVRWTAPEVNGVEFVFPNDTVRRVFDEWFRGRGVPRPRPAPDPFRVLLVEDNEFVRDLFGNALRRRQDEFSERDRFELVGAPDGLTALEALEHGEVHAAIVDHYLPVMTGCELIRRIRKDPRHETLPILVISSGGEEVRAEAIEAGANLYLDKPVLLEELVTTMKALMELQKRAA